MNNQGNHSYNSIGNVKCITFLQSFGVILVVFAHSTYLPPTPIYLVWVIKWVTAFYMPLFFFIAGYLFLYTNPDKDKININLFLVKKIKRIIIPYLILSLLAFIPKAFLADYANRQVGLSINAIISGLLIPENNPVTYFWFLPCIFMMYLLALSLYRSIWPKTGYGFMLSTLLFIVFYFINPLSNIKIFCIMNLPTYFIFFWLGSMFLVYEHKTNSLMSNKVILMLLFVLTIILTFTSDKYDCYIIRAIFGIMVSISLSKVVLSTKRDPFALINGYYYQIYLLSWFCITFIRILMYNKLGVSGYVVYITMFCFGLMLPVILAKVIKKTKYIKIAIGM
jgi:fucose 4-O-acetylase-like acetyltransferase